MAPKIRITAYHQHWHAAPGEGEIPSRLAVRADMETPEEAQELVGKFPKSVRLKTQNPADYSQPGTRIRADIDLLPDERTGAINETAVKRYKTLLKHAEKHGVEIAWDRSIDQWKDNITPNSYETQEDFEKALLHREQFHRP